MIGRRMHRQHLREPPIVAWKELLVQVLRAPPMLAQEHPASVRWPL
jgi:hypothetical protein